MPRATVLKAFGIKATAICFCALLLSLWAGRDTQARLVTEKASRQVVILVAASPGGQKELNPLAQSLGVSGIKAITLAPDTGPTSLAKLAKSLGKAVKDLARPPEVESLTLVAHGAGGLALAEYLRHKKEPKVNKALFLALPTDGLELPPSGDPCRLAWHKKIENFYGKDLLKQASPDAPLVKDLREKGLPHDLLVGVVQGSLDEKAVQSMLTRAGCIKELKSLGGDGVIEPGHPEELPGWSRDDRVYQAPGNHLSLPSTREVGDLLRRFIGLKPGTGSISCVLVIDGSGSVRSTDKENMRGQAVELLISRLMPGDQVGVVSFNLAPKTILPLTNITSRKQARNLAAGIKKLPATGDTNIAVGLARADEMFKKADPKKARVVVLMSDGKNDPETHNKATLEQVKKLAAQKAVLYTVGLTDNVDQKFLFNLARLSKGVYLYAPSAEGLTAAFDRVQAAMDQASLLLLAQDKAPNNYKLLLDSTVQRLDLSLLGPGDLLELKISDPQGRPLHPAKAKGREFSTVTLKMPVPGEYTLAISGPKDTPFRLQATARTSLKAKLEDKGKEPVAKAPWFFSLDVTEDDLPLDKVKAEVLIKDSRGKEHILDLKPAATGGFSASASSAGALSARFRGFNQGGGAEFRARIFGLNRKKEPFQRLIVQNLQITEKAASGGFGAPAKGRVFKEEVRP
ncbi:vWA domain-containing protein [Dethiosulfatarculus sandiegensis]|uniref:VWFA domain-containing protein n=1 Tax=Dethiosulfatarculus sandiegensis TaxID=1429043 RepID=A0A0D2GJ51_9BACT|nr:vWA domain-containing protein [Dethiosulfatarculus sandiegensis]KIX14832.1 hypothetical protein X474_06720 [Dethiosulfatarculus sandiegensis]